MAPGAAAELLGPPSPPLCTSAQVLAPCDLTDVPSTALAPARPPHVHDPLTCVSIRVTPCPHAWLSRPGILLPLAPPTASGSGDWVRGQGWEHPQEAGSKERMPHGPGGSQDSFGVTAGGTLGHTRGTLEPKEALDPRGGWKSSRGWERFQPVSVGPAGLGAVGAWGRAEGPGFTQWHRLHPSPTQCPDVPAPDAAPQPCSHGRWPLPSERCTMGGLRAWAPLLTRDPTLHLSMGGSWGVHPGGWPASPPLSGWPGTPETAQLQALESYHRGQRSA